jgi:hypothetical protein
MILLLFENFLLQISDFAFVVRYRTTNGLTVWPFPKAPTELAGQVPGDSGFSGSDHIKPRGLRQFKPNISLDKNGSDF